jgi:cardiolipin synthase
MREYCVQVEPARHPPRTAWRLLVSTLVFHVLHRFPGWAERLPAHRPKVQSMAPEAGEAPRTVDSPR